MITIKNKIEDNYFLPEDGKEAKAKFLEVLSLPEETFISCYAFTLPEAYAKIAELDALGIKQSLLLDYSQGNGATSKPKIKELIAKVKNTTVVLTAAGPNSDKPKSALWHIKGMVKISSDKRKGPMCVDGSTNMSISGFSQGNIMRFFRNKAWADTFIQQHVLVRDWALQNLPHYQPGILAKDEDAVDFFFKQLEDLKNDSEFLI
jgi:hypothetical protein